MATGGQKRAKHLRSISTLGEEQLWQALRHLDDPRFRRQKALGPYVLDFYAPRYQLCVEVDGPYHEVERDRVRDAWLLERGVFTLRFKAEDLNVEAILAEVARTCAWLRPRFRLKPDPKNESKSTRGEFGA